MNKIVIELDVEDLNEGIDLISIVNKPAIESTFIKLSAEDELAVQLSANDERQELTGAVLIPDKEIRRIDANGDEYYIKFTAEAITRIKRRFLQTGKLNLSNLDHSKHDVITAELTDIWTVEDAVSDRSVALGLKDVVKGSLMVTYHIPDKAVWDIIKTGDYNGFSLEGIFKQKQALSAVEDKSIEDMLADVLKMIEGDE
jgi:hypothetical protein